MALSLILFAFGFWILIKGANVLVDGASSLARRLGVSSFVIGLVIVGIGTSIPEFAVAFLGNLIGEADISLGTIIGSNTFNLLVILGLAAIVRPLEFRPVWVGRDLVWNAAAVALAGLVALDGSSPAGISRGEGTVLLLAFILWLVFALRQPPDDAERSRSFHAIALPLAAFMIGAGLAGVLLGGKWVVDGAVVIAAALGISPAFIGLTIVGIGTSLPELAISLTAAWRRQTGIAVGNIIGSNIFDFLLIIGASAVARTVVFPAALAPDIALTFGAALLLIGVLSIGGRYTLKGWQGLGFVLLYLLYLAYLVIRG